MWLALALAFGTTWLLYYLWTSKYNYWRERGFPFLEPSFPFGNLKELVLFTRYQGYVHQDIYYKAAPNPYVGIFSLRQPILFIRDPEIIKHVMVKDFNHFRNRLVNKSFHVLSEHLFNLHGDKWRAMRMKLTPTFTSGKLKSMYVHFQTSAEQLNKLLKEKTASQKAIDIKDIMFRFTSDIIATCAFGLELNMMANDNSEFLEVGKLIFPQETQASFKIRNALISISPLLEHLARFSPIPKRIINFVLGTVNGTVEYREKNNIKRNDFLDLLIELKNKSSRGEASRFKGEEEKNPVSEQNLEMTMELLAAQCFVFLVAGFETSSSVQSYCMYELALNPDIQEKLRDEIDEVTAKHGGLTYQAIQEMEYLDQVVSETIRKYPTLPFLNRTCSKTYEMPDSGLIVEEGTRIVIPVFSLHHDPEYFPDPEKFDPDRFSPERKSSIKPYTYLPFGEGPRLCIGMRFGLLQTKTGLCTMLKNYKLLPAPETKVPLDFVCSGLITITKGQIMLKIEPRLPKKDE